MLTEEHFDMLTRFRARAMGDKLSTAPSWYRRSA